MSEAKRYAMTWATDEDEFVHVSPVESASGKWVNFEDYARLKAFSDEAQAHIAKEERKSRERLDMEQAENARLKAEFERLTPLMKTGGFIPSVDHQTPPGVSLEDYQIFLRLLKKHSGI